MTTIPYSEISSISLYPLSDEDNKIESHVTILYQDSTRGNIPYQKGVSDAHMGSYSNEWNCQTCLHDKRLCPGHFGSINLKYPVPSPFYVKEILKWLKVTCFSCGKLVITYKKLPVRKDKILGEYVKLATRATGKNLNCIHCGAVHPYIFKDKSDPVSIYMGIYDTKSTGDTKSKPKDEDQLYPHLIATILNKIEDETVLQMGKPLVAHPRKFILKVLKVPTNPMKPDIRKIGGGRSNNNDLTVLLAAIVKGNDDFPSSIPSVIDKDLKIKIHNLCLTVYDLIKGSSSTSKRTIVNNSKKPLTSIAKRWPRKFGRVRRNLMGRRASHMGRSFITCDPYLKIDEVGVPISIARNIQFPEKVLEQNYEQMLLYFMNGTKRYPGCTKITKVGTGKTYFVDNVKKLEIGDIIYRDVIGGELLKDCVDFNRQPSLESSSISCMKTVIMEKGDTLRINVLSCSLFNADFDGDEQ